VKSYPPPRLSRNAFGCRRLPESKKQQSDHRVPAEEVETKLIILPYDAEANWHAAERAGLVGTGEPPLSRWANCGDRRVNDLILVTNNTSDYADFQNLQLQNWFIPIRSLFMPVTSDIVQKLWNLCHVLRDDGITYLQYYRADLPAVSKMMQETEAKLNTDGAIWLIWKAKN